MSLFSRLFGHHAEQPRIVSPDDSAIRSRLEAAKRESNQAVNGLIAVAEKQIRDAEYARHVVSEVLARAERIKVQRNAGIQE